MQAMNSKSLFERSLKVAPGGVHSPVRSFKNLGITPIFFRAADGAYLESVEGKRYIDFCMSFGPLILGHRDREVEEAVIEQIKTAWSFGACEPYSLELAEWMQARLPWVEKLRFVSSGTEAVMSALRVARAATQRNKILKFEGCYHGHADPLLVKAGSGLAGIAASTSAGVSDQVASDTLVSPLDDEASLEKIFADFGSEIACVAIEPLPANYGLLPQRRAFLERCAELCRKHGALLLMDEVISGFRVGMGGMAEESGIRPDLVCYGKIIGAGFPVGCYGGRRDLMDLVAPLGPVYQAGTLSANPIGMRAGLTTLKKLEREAVHETLAARTKKFKDGLQKLFDERSLGLQVVSHASLFWIHPKTATPVRSTAGIPQDLSTRFAPLFRAALEKGIYLAPNAYEVGFISLAHTDAVLAEALDRMKEALRALD